MLSSAAAALPLQIYSDVNNAVYQSGFATSQAAYSAAQAKLHSTLQQLDSALASSRFLAGDR
jgi:putative glutathione S-transferase